MKNGCIARNGSRRQLGDPPSSDRTLNHNINNPRQNEQFSFPTRALHLLLRELQTLLREQVVVGEDAGAARKQQRVYALVAHQRVLREGQVDGDRDHACARARRGDPRDRGVRGSGADREQEIRTSGCDAAARMIDAEKSIRDLAISRQQTADEGAARTADDAKHEALVAGNGQAGAARALAEDALLLGGFGRRLVRGDAEEGAHSR